VLASCKLSAWPPSPRAGRDLPLAAEHRQCAPCSHTRDRCGKQKARRPLGSGCPCTAPFGPVQMRRCASILKVCIQPRARQARRRQALHLPAARAQHSAAGAGRGRTGPWRARFHGTQGRLSAPGRCNSPTFPARPRRHLRPTRRAGKRQDARLFTQWQAARPPAWTAGAAVPAGRPLRPRCRPILHCCRSSGQTHV